MRFNLAKGQCESLWHTLQNKVPDGLIIEIHTKQIRMLDPFLEKLCLLYIPFHSMSKFELDRHKLGLHEQFSLAIIYYFFR